MKHTRNVTVLLLGLFFLAQLVGLAIVNNYVTYETVVKDGETVVEQNWEALPYAIERPEFEQDTSYLPLILIILFASVIVLIIAKLKAVMFWKAWFFLSILFCLVIAFGAFVGEVPALVLGTLFALLKVSRKSVVGHNFTELFIYGGLAAIFVPVFNVWSISVLLILISIYDFIAVHKTKHMITLAEFQSKAKLFAGLLIPYGKKKTAVLGGGDIAFPLMFTAVLYGLYGVNALLVTVTTTLSLGYLLWISEKNKFYPAMPFVTVGCFVGYVILLLL